MSNAQFFEDECIRLGLQKEPKRFTLDMFKETLQLLKQTRCHLKSRMMEAALKCYSRGGNPAAPWCL